MKERVEEFEKQFTCLGEDIKKYVEITIYC